jgi:hypothetical protein
MSCPCTELSAWWWLLWPKHVAKFTLLNVLLCFDWTIVWVIQHNGTATIKKKRYGEANCGFSLFCESAWKSYTILYPCLQWNVPEFQHWKTDCFLYPMVNCLFCSTSVSKICVAESHSLKVVGAYEHLTLRRQKLTCTLSKDAFRTAHKTTSLSVTKPICKKKVSAPLYRHWGSVQPVWPIGGVEV